MSSFDYLAGTFGSMAGAARPLLLAAGVALILVLAHYLYADVRGFLQQLFALPGYLAGFLVGTELQTPQGVQRTRGALDDVLDALRAALESLQARVTYDGKFKFALMVVAVAVLLPLVLVALYADVHMISQYFQALFNDVVDTPLGPIPGGLLQALLIVAAASLLGLLAEALLGLLPLPLLDLAPQQVRAGLRIGLLTMAAVLWLWLSLTVADIAMEVYAGLGPAKCDTSLSAPGAPEDELTLDSLLTLGAAVNATPGAAAEPSQGDAAASAQAQAEREQCLAAWRGNGRARAIYVARAVIALHVGGLFTWVLFPAAALLALLLLGLAKLAVHVLVWVGRVFQGLPGVLFVLVDLALRIVSRVGGWVVMILRRLGVPLPPANDADQPAAQGPVPGTRQDDAIGPDAEAAQGQPRAAGDTPPAAAGAAGAAWADAPAAPESGQAAPAGASGASPAAGPNTPPRAAAAPPRRPAQPRGTWDWSSVDDAA